MNKPTAKSKDKKPLINLFGFKIKLEKEVYGIEEDTYFLLDFLEELKEKYRFNSVLEIGVGCGIVSLFLSTFSVKVIACDVNKKAIALSKENCRLNNIDNVKVIYSDLFRNIRRKFDLIVFNAPYLPLPIPNEKDKIELSFCGGQNMEVIERFLQEVNSYLTKDGFFILLLSSLSSPQKFISKYSLHIIKRKKLWFEELLILSNLNSF